MKKFATIAAVAFAMFTGSVGAAGFDAKISKIKGIVLVNQGESYSTAREGMALNAGDRLMVMQDAALDLVYEDGCNASFKESKIIEISKLSTCAGGVAVVESTNPMVADAAPGGEAVAGEVVAESTIPTAAMVAGGVVVVGAAIAASGNNASAE